MKYAAMILIFPSVDARTKQDMTDVKVFVGFTGVNKLATEKYDTSTAVRGALFFTSSEFREASDSITHVLNAENTRNNTSRCYAGLKIEIGDAVIWHEAEEHLDQN